MFGTDTRAPLGRRLAAVLLAITVGGTGFVAATPAEAASHHRHRPWIHRGHHPVVRHHRRPIHHDRHHSYRHHRVYRYHDDGGAWVGAGIAGLAAGALLGGVLAPHYSYAPPRVIYAPSNRRPWTAAWYRYCENRYRSFDPRSGTFLGYDGRRHFCN